MLCCISMNGTRKKKESRPDSELVAPLCFGFLRLTFNSIQNIRIGRSDARGATTRVHSHVRRKCSKIPDKSFARIQNSTSGTKTAKQERIPVFCVCVWNCTFVAAVKYQIVIKFNSICCSALFFRYLPLCLPFIVRFSLLQSFPGLFNNSAATLKQLFETQLELDTTTKAK